MSHSRLISYISYSIFIRVSISLWSNLLIWSWLTTLEMSSKNLGPTDFWTKLRSWSTPRSTPLARMCTARHILTPSMVEHSRLWVRSWISLLRIVVFFIRWVLSGYDINPHNWWYIKDHAVYKQFKGVVLDEEEGSNIAEALGPKKVCKTLSQRNYYIFYLIIFRLLFSRYLNSEFVIFNRRLDGSQNHGLLVATEYIESTVFFYISLEKWCVFSFLSFYVSQISFQLPGPTTRGCRRQR